MFRFMIIILFSFDVTIGTHQFNHWTGKKFIDTFERQTCRTVSKELNMNIVRSFCQPREMMVAIEPDVSYVTIIPNKVPVKMCDGGSCFGGLSCLPTKIETVPFAIRQHNFVTRKETCGIIQVVQHVECACGCPVKEYHCNPRQEYKLHECKCVCKHSELELDCLMKGKHWDHNTCECMCHEKNPQCSTGTEWVPSMCKCAQVMHRNDISYIDFKE